MVNYDFIVDVLSIVFACIFVVLLLCLLFYGFFYFLLSDSMKRDYIKKLKEEKRDDIVSAISYYNHLKPNFCDVFRKRDKK